MELVGTKGAIRLGRSNADNVITINDEDGIRRPFVSSWTYLFKDAYLAEDISFVEAIVNDTETAVTGRDGLMAVKIVEEGNALITARLKK